MEDTKSVLKESKAWYIAATHYLTAWFAIPFIISLVFWLLILPFISGLSIMIQSILISLIWIISIAWGVIYSSWYLNKTYQINEEIKTNVIKFAISYIVILSWFSRINLIKIEWFTTSTIIELLFYIWAVFTFYVLSKKYIKTNK